jgi:hypothetical protein
VVEEPTPAADDRFVVRAARGSVVAFAWLGALFAIVAGAFGWATFISWRFPDTPKGVGFAVQLAGDCGIWLGVLIVPIAISVYVRSRRDRDRHGIRLRIDGAGVYLGGRHSRHLAWPEVARVVLYDYVEGGGEEPETRVYGVQFELWEPDPRPRNPFGARPPGDGPAREWLAEDAHERIRAVVGRQAPGVPVVSWSAAGPPRP